MSGVSAASRPLLDQRPLPAYAHSPAWAASPPVTAHSLPTPAAGAAANRTTTPLGSISMASTLLPVPQSTWCPPPSTVPHTTGHRAPPVVSPEPPCPLAFSRPPATAAASMAAAASQWQTSPLSHVLAPQPSVTRPPPSFGTGLLSLTRSSMAATPTRSMPAVSELRVTQPPTLQLAAGHSSLAAAAAPMSGHTFSAERRPTLAVQQWGRQAESGRGAEERWSEDMAEQLFDDDEDRPIFLRSSPAALSSKRAREDGRQYMSRWGCAQDERREEEQKSDRRVRVRRSSERTQDGQEVYVQQAEVEEEMWNGSPLVQSAQSQRTQAPPPRPLATMSSAATALPRTLSSPSRSSDLSYSRFVPASSSSRSLPFDNCPPRPDLDLSYLDADDEDAKRQMLMTRQQTALRPGERTRGAELAYHVPRVEGRQGKEEWKEVPPIHYQVSQRPSALPAQLIQQTATVGSAAASTPRVPSFPSHSSPPSSSHLTSASSVSAHAAPSARHARLSDTDSQRRSGGGWNGAFMRPEHIRDASSKRPTDAGYNPRTLYVPRDEYDNMSGAQQQYFDIKSQYWDVVLFHKVGMFYKLYDQDADIGVTVLDLTYTVNQTRSQTSFRESDVVKNLRLLIAAGYKVGRVEQMQEPQDVQDSNKQGADKKGKAKGKQKGLVKRELSQVYTAGTMMDLDLIQSYAANYFLSLTEHTLTAEERQQKKDAGECTALSGEIVARYGICYLDASIGAFTVGEFFDDDPRTQLATLLATLNPLEVAYPLNTLSKQTMLVFRNELSAHAKKQPWVLEWDKRTGWRSAEETWKWLDESGCFEQQRDERGVTLPADQQEMMWPHALDALMEQRAYLAFEALGGCCRCLERLKTVKRLLTQRNFSLYTARQAGPQADHMLLDNLALSNLEIMRAKTEADTAGSVKGSLLDYVDWCQSPAGHRLIRRWVSQPLANIMTIMDRQNAVTFLMRNTNVHIEAKKLLKLLPDLERQLSAVHSYSVRRAEKEMLYGKQGKKRLRLFRSLTNGLLRAQEVRTRVFANLTRTDVASMELAGVTLQFPDYAHIIRTFDAYTLDWAEAVENGHLTPVQGAREEYDAAVATKKDVKAKLNKHLEQVRADLNCREVRYYHVDQHRYVLNIPDGVRLGSEYTLVIKGYYTSGATEALVLTLMAAEQRKTQLEEEMTRDMYAEFVSYCSTWQKAVSALATLDCLCSLADVSDWQRQQGYSVKPTVLEWQEGRGATLDVRESVHPVLLKGGLPGGKTFIPNDIVMGAADCPARFLLISGPNMGGKCFQRGTLLLLYTGDTIAVEDVRGGDELMGDDGRPRTVIDGSVRHYNQPEKTSSSSDSEEEADDATDATDDSLDSEDAAGDTDTDADADADVDFMTEEEALEAAYACMDEDARAEVDAIADDELEEFVQCWRDRREAEQPVDPTTSALEDIMADLRDITMSPRPDVAFDLLDDLPYVEQALSLLLSPHVLTPSPTLSPSATPPPLLTPRTRARVLPRAYARQQRVSVPSAFSKAWSPPPSTRISRAEGEAEAGEAPMTDDPVTAAEGASEVKDVVEVVEVEEAEVESRKAVDEKVTLARREKLWQVIPNYSGATPFTVNGAHILVLVNNTRPRLRKRADRKSARWQLKRWMVDPATNAMKEVSETCDPQTAAQTKLAAALAEWTPLEWEVSVEQYHAATREVRRLCMLISCGRAISFNNDQYLSLHAVLTSILGLEPSTVQLHYIAWWLGMWLTDGDTSGPSVYQGGAPPPDKHSHHEIFYRLHHYSVLFSGGRVKQVLNRVSSAGWHAYTFSWPSASVAARVLAAYKLRFNKHVPQALICDTVDVRRHFMAGIIDGDGRFDRNKARYELCAKHRVVCQGYESLAASLGLRNGGVLLHRQRKSEEMSDTSYDGYRIFVLGHSWHVAQHCAATYKRCTQPGTADYRIPNKDPRCFGFRLRQVAAANYCGFAVKGNRRFLLADYTVTHNVSTQAHTCTKWTITYTARYLPRRSHASTHACGSPFSCVPCNLASPP